MQYEMLVSKHQLQTKCQFLTICEIFAPAQVSTVYYVNCKPMSADVNIMCVILCLLYTVFWFTSCWCRKQLK